MALTYQQRKQQLKTLSESSVGRARIKEDYRELLRGAANKRLIPLPAPPLTQMIEAILSVEYQEQRESPRR